MTDPIEYWRNDLPKCPHCGSKFEVWDHDHPMSLNYDDGGTTEFSCRSCHKDFVTVTHIEYKFSTAVSEEAASDEEWGPQEAEAL